MEKSSDNRSQPQVVEMERVIGGAEEVELLTSALRTRMSAKIQVFAFEEVAAIIDFRAFYIS